MISPNIFNKYDVLSPKFKSGRNKGHKLNGRGKQVYLT